MAKTKRSELREKLLALVTEMGVLPPAEAKRLASRLCDMAYGWMRTPESEGDAFLTAFKAKLLEEFSPKVKKRKENSRGGGLKSSHPQ
jgi:hypothetical protein